MKEIYIFKDAALLLLLSLSLTACVSTPHSSPSEDAAAKTFLTKPKMANLYIYRESAFAGSAGGWDVVLDGRTLAILTNGTYIFVEVEPGEHTLSRLNIPVSYLQPPIRFRFDENRNNFVSMQLNPLNSESKLGTTSFREVSEEDGRSAVSILPRVITLY